MKNFILALVCLICFGTFANADNGRRQPVRVQTHHNYYRQDFRFQRIVIGDYSQQYVAPDYSQQLVVPTQQLVVPTQQVEVPVQPVVIQRVVTPSVYTQPIVVQRVVVPTYGYRQSFRIRGY